MTTTPEYDRLKHLEKDGYDLNKLSTSTPKALDAVSEYDERDAERLDRASAKLWANREDVFAEPQQAAERHLTVTTDEQGRCVAVTWQDEDHRVLEVVWEAQQAAKSVAASDGAIDVALNALEILDRRPRPMCRDCADENGTCPSSGLPCDMSAVIRGARAAAKSAAPAAVSERQLIDAAPEPFKRLGALLARLLDEDQFKTAEAMLLGGLMAIQDGRDIQGDIDHYNGNS